MTVGVRTVEEPGAISLYDEYVLAHARSDYVGVRGAIKLLQASRHDAALAAFRALPAKSKSSREVRFQIAAALRRRGDVDAALRHLSELRLTATPFGRLHEELAWCAIANGREDDAVEHFEDAVRLNPALLASWTALSGHYPAMGDTRRADFAARHIGVLARQPDELLDAAALLADGEAVLADFVLVEYAAVRPGRIETLRLIARSAALQGRDDWALRFLREAARLDGSSNTVHVDVARILVRTQRYSEALSWLREKPLACNTGLLLSAMAEAGLGRHSEALTIFEKILRTSPTETTVQVLKGHSERAVGLTLRAVESYRAAAAYAKPMAEAYWGLANLKTYRFSEREMTTMQQQLNDRRITVTQRIYLHFSYAKALEDDGAYAPAWEHYCRGNRLKAAEVRFDLDRVSEHFEHLKNFYRSELFMRHEPFGHDSFDPIFIVGLPRSGSTLVEQILASHSAVCATTEMPHVPALVRDLQQRTGTGHGAPYPECIGDLRGSDLRRLADNYLRDSAPYRDERPRFLDKMPNNFQHIGLIHLLFPHARIIDVRRDAMACCVSNLRQLYVSGHEFSYDERWAGGYYRAYEDLMAHWNTVLPGRIHTVAYETLVEDLEGAVRRLLAACELEFEPACLSFHRTPRTVSTVSSEQVRRPLNRDGIDSWRRFEPWLDNLKDALWPPTGRRGRQ